MLKYHAAALGLKLFSINAATRFSYRAISNQLGARRRSREVRPGYFARANRNLRFIESNVGSLDGFVCLELGTGWVHWEALFTSLFYDVNFILFDVWDNRQFLGFTHYANQLRNRLRLEIQRTDEELSRAEVRLDQILACESFDEVYNLLGWKYVINPDGSLHAISEQSIDLIISSDVLEHVYADSVHALMRDHFRILRPGGHAAHQIVFNDHLAIYDSEVHPKNYLRYSDAVWRLIGHNDVQYINRIQPSEFDGHFLESGLLIKEKIVTDSCDLSCLNVSQRYKHFSLDDLQTSVKSYLLQKPF